MSTNPQYLDAAVQQYVRNTVTDAFYYDQIDLYLNNQGQAVSLPDEFRFAVGKLIHEKFGIPVEMYLKERGDELVMNYKTLHSAGNEAVADIKISANDWRFVPNTNAVAFYVSPANRTAFEDLLRRRLNLQENYKFGWKDSQPVAQAPAAAPPTAPPAPAKPKFDVQKYINGGE